MRALRTTFAATVLAAAAVAVVACAPTPPVEAAEAVAPRPPRRPRRPRWCRRRHRRTSPSANPPAIGTLKFFNAAGVQITGGNINDAPFAAYIQSSAPGRVGDTKATLFGYLPKAGIDWDGWSGDQLTRIDRLPERSRPRRRWRRRRCRSSASRPGTARSPICRRPTPTRRRRVTPTTASTTFG